MGARRAVSELSDLLGALRADGCLAWLFVHAPDGDADGAVRRAWEGETGAHALATVTWMVGTFEPANRALLAAGARVGCTCLTPPQVFDCRVCCDAIRAAVECPTWAELTRSEG